MKIALIANLITLKFGLKIFFMLHIYCLPQCWWLFFWHAAMHQIKLICAQTHRHTIFIKFMSYNCNSSVYQSQLNVLLKCQTQFKFVHCYQIFFSFVSLFFFSLSLVMILYLNMSKYNYNSTLTTTVFSLQIQFDLVPADWFTENLLFRKTVDLQCCTS